jgi:integrase
MAAEANLSLLRQHAAVILARQAALRAVKRQIQREGRVKLSTLSAATLARLGNEWLGQHPELIAEAAQSDIILIKAARDSRYGHRDATLILIAFRHGLRASEICDLEWSQVEFGRSASLHVRRVKNGKPSVHPLRGDEVRALRELRRQFPDSSFVFATERAGHSRWTQ